MDLTSLTEQATNATGLDGWGGDTFRDGLGHLVDALNREAALSELGRLALETQI
jgi:hypothetical protein